MRAALPLAVAMAVAPLLGLGAALPPDPVTIAYVPHPPILIQGDGGFLLPTSGVRNPFAAGTAEDPYVIEGWDLAAIGAIGPVVGHVGVPAIRIESTTKHVVVRGNHVMGALLEPPPRPVPVLFLDVEEVGVSLFRAANVTIDGNVFEHFPQIYGYAVDAWQSDDLRVQRNTFLASLDALKAYQGDRLVVEDNAFAGDVDTGARLEQTNGAVVRRNTFATQEGLDLDGGRDVTVEDNRFAPPASGYAGTGIFVGYYATVSIAHNDVAGMGEAIFVFGIQNDVDVAFNNLSGRGLGVEVWDHRLEDVRIHDNNVAGQSFTGAETSSSAQGLLDARGNWWGCAAGPNQPGCASVPPNVLADPWRTSPVAVAGPRA
jgi:hypothetical protein